MSHLRFGELLSRQVELSDHDVSEILEEQGSSRRRFGEIALALRLCQPEHIWLAWWEQLADASVHIDLDEVGVDAQALSQLPLEVVQMYGVLPIRCTQQHLVVAVSEKALEHAQRHLHQHFSGQIRFVLAPADQIQATIQNTYQAYELLQLSA